MKIRDTGGIELPEQKVATIRTPAKAIAQVKFLFVDPIRGPIDEGFRAIGRQRLYQKGGDILEEKIVVPHEGNRGSIRREFGKH